ncbi:MAG TPA: carboxypeptidase regulatory-like domain-containing protein [Vicinamibacterales bacterium]|nr:carboxypeptidase regulatory-like domain-containing protein [Vicinamibacterales bacterium]
MRIRFAPIVLAFLLPLFAHAASAQTQITTGVIQGTVTDSSGASVPGATVEVRNVDTNLVRSLVTEADGRFVFLQLPPGTYRVTFTLAGFATLVQEPVVLTVGQAVILPAVMKVSSVAETVTVRSSSGVVESSRTAAASTLNELTIETTPILGRKFEDLLTLTPGVSIVQGPDGDEITFAGQRGIFNNISLDGGDYNNGFFGEQAGGQRAAIDITLEAVKEFQVIATGAPAEFGRTAGGVVNVITKSGTNRPDGSLFFFLRNEGLSSELSDGTNFEELHREQWGGTIGGPIRRDKAFFFAALEGINGDFLRPNLSRQLGPSACPVANPNIQEHEALIDGNADCQRTALLSFLDTSVGIDDGRPIPHPIETYAFLGKTDVVVNDKNNVSASWNFNHSRKENETFDVATYGNSANGIEGDPARINVANLNWFTTLSSRMLNEAHFTYSRESRPRRAVDSNLAADTGMGFDPTFRFGNPFFLQPNIDELVWRTQIKNNLSLVMGTHTVKVGGEWMHTLNDQVFRGFFTGRYLFGSVTGFLRYASPAAAGGFGPSAVNCSDGTWVTSPAPCPADTTVAGPLLLYLQGAGLTGPATDAAGASKVTNEEFALFVQDQWQPRSNITVHYGLRWDAQLMPETVDPRTTAYGAFLDDPAFPSDGTIPDQWAMFQPRAGVAWDVKGDGKSVLRGSAGIYSARQNMLSQVGSVTTNGLQQQTLFSNTANHVAFGAPTPVWPGVLTPAPVAPGEFPLFSGVRVFHRDYKNPRIYSFNAAYEQELAPDWSGYVDFTWTEGRNLTRFLDYNRGNPRCCDIEPGTGNKFLYDRIWGPQLDEVMVANSLGESRYRGVTFGIRKRFSQGYQLEANYVIAKDEDNDSNERDPFTDRSFNFFDLDEDWGPSDRDIRHKVNVFGYADVRGGFHLNVRIQGRTAQPITPNPRSLDGVDRGRNSERKDNAFFSFDWRLARPFRFGTRYQVIPIIEMFNTFNNTNNINPLSTPALFDFAGFLRAGVGDPRQVQLAVKFLF